MVSKLWKICIHHRDGLWNISSQSQVNVMPHCTKQMRFNFCGMISNLRECENAIMHLWQNALLTLLLFVANHIVCELCSCGWRMFCIFVLWEGGEGRGGRWPREELAGHVLWLLACWPGGHTYGGEGCEGGGGIWVVMERLWNWGVKSSRRDEERWRALWTRKKGEGWLRRKRVIEAASSRSNGSSSSISSDWGEGEGRHVYARCNAFGGSVRTWKGRVASWPFMLTTSHPVQFCTS